MPRLLIACVASVSVFAVAGCERVPSPSQAPPGSGPLGAGGPADASPPSAVTTEATADVLLPPSADPEATPRRAPDLAHRVAVSWSQVRKARKHNAKGLKQHGKRRYDRALAEYREAWTANPNHVFARYNAACASALLGRREQALALLSELRDMGGFRAHKQLRRARVDEDFQSLWADPAFLQLTEVADPPALFAVGADMGLWGVPALLSDSLEQYCFRPETEPRLDDCGGQQVHVFDCDSGTHRTSRRVTSQGACELSEAAYSKKLQDTDAWLQTWGAVEWLALGGEEAARAEAWFERALAAEVEESTSGETLQQVLMSPSRSRVAFHTCLMVGCNDGVDPHCSVTVVSRATVFGD